MTLTQRDLIVSPPDRSQIYNSTVDSVDSRINGVWDSRRTLESKVSSILRPVHPAFNPFDAQVATVTTFQGAMYYTGQTVILNRLIFNVDNGYTAGDTCRILMFQDQNNDGTFERVLTIENFDPGGNVVASATPTESPVVLLPGMDIVMLWGDDGGGGAFDITCYANSTIELLNGSTTVPTGVAPTVFDTTVAANTSPASIDPTVGGANGFIGLDASDAAVVFRTEKV
jgi:hypothetical protein